MESLSGLGFVRCRLVGDLGHPPQHAYRDHGVEGVVHTRDDQGDRPRCASHAEHSRGRKGKTPFGRPADRGIEKVIERKGCCLDAALTDKRVRASADIDSGGYEVRAVTAERGAGVARCGCELETRPRRPRRTGRPGVTRRAGRSRRPGRPRRAGVAGRTCRPGVALIAPWSHRSLRAGRPPLFQFSEVSFDLQVAALSITRRAPVLP